MRLLILTQAVDLDDPILGFFHGWILELAKKCEKVSVVCLKEGRHELPANVHVYSLGKSAQGRPASGWGRIISRVGYITRFYKYIWTLRHEYDSVFVHMNPEYVLMGGIMWKALGKKIVLWYVHPKRPIVLQIAVLLSHAVCTVTESSIALKSKKIHAVGHGINVDAFHSGIPAIPRSILSLGRLDPVKRTEILIEALDLVASTGVSFTAAIYGSPVVADSKYSHDLRNKMMPLTLTGALVLHDAVPNAQTPAIYAAHSIYVNLTPSGSFDKTILEAMAAERVVIASNSSLADIIPEELRSDGTAQGTAKAIITALAFSEDKMREIGRRNRSYVQGHSLPLLISRLIQILQ